LLSAGRIPTGRRSRRNESSQIYLRSRGSGLFSSRRKCRVFIKEALEERLDLRGPVLLKGPSKQIHPGLTHIRIYVFQPRKKLRVGIYLSPVPDFRVAVEIGQHLLSHVGYSLLLHAPEQ